MPKYLKIAYASSKNITVQGSVYFELGDDDFDDNGEVKQDRIADLWQDAVNEFMADTGMEVVDNEGD